MEELRLREDSEDGEETAEELKDRIRRMEDDQVKETAKNIFS